MVQLWRWLAVHGACLQLALFSAALLTVHGRQVQWPITCYSMLASVSR
jgi:hypothetical protein